MVGEAGQKKRRSTNYPQEFKRQLAQQACDESISVAQLALQHGLNTNMLFRWRRQLRAGLLDKGTQFLPVALEAKPNERANVESDGGRIEIQLGQAKVCIHGAPDPDTLALVLQRLRP